MTQRGCRVAAGVALAMCMAAPARGQSGPSPFKAPTQVDTGALSGPRQPIFFRHDIHAGQDRIPCLYCHYAVAASSEPGIPSLETCMGCHRLVSGSTPGNQAEIKKLRDAASNGQPPQWVRVHALPGFVHFPHMRHIKVLGTNACITCHGDVAKTTQIAQVSTLRMGWCVNCHVQKKVSRDCTVCHY